MFTPVASYKIDSIRGRKSQQQLYIDISIEDVATYFRGSLLSPMGQEKMYS